MSDFVPLEAMYNEGMLYILYEIRNTVRISYILYKEGFISNALPTPTRLAGRKEESLDSTLL